LNSFVENEQKDEKANDLSLSNLGNDHIKNKNRR
jgi:hypothetical protein